MTLSRILPTILAGSGLAWATPAATAQAPAPAPAPAQEETAAEETVPPPDATNAAPPSPAKAKATTPAKSEVPDSEIAFRVRLTSVPGQEVLILRKDWDEYTDMLKRTYQPKSFDSLHRNALGQLCRVAAMKLWYHEELPALEQEARAVLRKLGRGVSFERVVKAHCDDSTARSSGGKLGTLKRRGHRYPLEMALFDVEVGTIVGPLLTEHGYEVFRVDDRGGEAGTRESWVDVSYVVMVYQGEVLVSKPKWEKLMREMRLRSTFPEFTALIPPARREAYPDSYGPRDLAPMGHPDQVEKASAKAIPHLPRKAEGDDTR